MSNEKSDATMGAGQTEDFPAGVLSALELKNPKVGKKPTTGRKGPKTVVNKSADVNAKKASASSKSDLTPPNKNIDKIINQIFDQGYVFRQNMEFYFVIWKIFKDLEMTYDQANELESAKYSEFLKKVKAVVPNQQHEYHNTVGKLALTEDDSVCWNEIISYSNKLSTHEMTKYVNATTANYNNKIIGIQQNLDKLNSKMDVINTEVARKNRMTIDRFRA